MGLSQSMDLIPIALIVLIELALRSNVYFDRFDMFLLYIAPKANGSLHDFFCNEYEAPKKSDRKFP